MATSRRVGNYARSAAAVTKSADQIFDAAMSGKPDFGLIAKEAIKGRSLERRAAAEAEGRVKVAGINAKAKVKGYEIAADRDKAIADIKRPARRMAGIVGGLGSLAGAYMLKKESDISKRERAEDRLAQQEVNNKTMQLLQEEAEKRETFMNEIMQLNKGSSGVASDDDPEPEPSNYPVSTAPTASPSPSPNAPSGGASFPGGVLTKAQVRQYALDAGFSPNQAATVVGIAGGESGFDPTNSTRRKIPGRKNLYETTGEDSVGLMQINWGYHKDRGWLQDLGITSREQLLDPATNMKAAKYLYDGRGNFGDWTVYNKGIYKDYL